MTVSKDAVRDGNIYVYKLTCDNGGAPCIYGRELSLSICKPRIRMDAQVGDWIVGFGGKSKPELRDRLIYIARITTAEANGEYYAKPEYRKRPDCVYRRTESGFEYVPGSRYHEPEDLQQDLGSSPAYERARNLLSDEFAYFGAKQGPSIESVRDIYDDLPRDFVKNHAPEVRRRLEDFIVSVFTQFGPGAHGRPTHGDTAAKCHDSEGDDLVVPRCST